MKPRWVVFDLDGTLVDSDRALLEPFLRMGVPERELRLGPLLVEECARLGVSADAYLRLYDSTSVDAFPGVHDLVRGLDRWALCSNKVMACGMAELARLGWAPKVAMFAEDFDGAPKSLQPVLDRLGVPAAEILFVGDTSHDRACARSVGATFALAGWNRRARAGAEPGDVVLDAPADVLAHVDAGH